MTDQGECAHKNKRMGLCDGDVKLYAYEDSLGILVPDVPPEWLCQRHQALQDGAEPF